MDFEFAVEPEIKRNFVYKAKTEETRKARLRKKKNKELKKKYYQDEMERIAEREKELMSLKVDHKELIQLYLTNNINEETIRVEKLISKKNQLKGQKGKKKMKMELEEDEMDLPRDDFHNIYESKEIRDCYSDLNYGDYFMVFPNPDHESTYNRGVMFVEAMDAYNKMLTVDGVVVKKDIVQKEKEAFKDAFLSLEEYDPEEEEGEENAQMMGEDMKPGKRMKNRKQLKREKKKAKLDRKKKLKLKKENEMRLKNIEKKNQSVDPEGEFNKEIKKYSHIKKKFCKGGFLAKRMLGEEVDDYEWVCTDSRPADFLTLIRFSIMTTLTQKAGLHCRQFLSQGGAKIIILVQSNEKLLKNIANETGFSKQLELGACDLFSLEPVDSNYRPLRLKAFVNDQDIIREIQAEKEQEEKSDPVTIESKAKGIFQNIRKMEEEDLQYEVTRMKLKVDKWLSKVQKQVKIDLPQQKEILDDCELDRKEWETYYIYLHYLEDYFKRIDNLRKALDPIFRIQEKIEKQAMMEGKDPSKVKVDENTIIKSKKKDEFEPIRTNLFFIYRLIFQKAIQDSNNICDKFYSSFFQKLKKSISGSRSGVLKNFWEKYGLTPTPPYIEFFSGNKESEHIWRRYEVNERGDRSIFSNMERIKLTNAILLLHLNLFKLIKNKYMESYSPVHENYQKDGQIKEPLFKPIYDSGFAVKEQPTIGHKKLMDMFTSLNKYGDAIDFDTDGDALVDDVRFRWLRPWEMDISSMRNYFGEKIALYFLFLTSYTKGLAFMAIAGVVLQAVVWANVGDGAYTVIAIAYVILNIVWSTTFLEKWKNTQSKFALEFGQKEIQGDSAVRPGFDGDFIRSLDNDEMNEEFYSSRKRKMKMGISYLISLILICGCITCVILLLFFRNFAENEGWPKLITNVFPSLLNSIQIFVFNFLYQNVALICNDFENHKYLTSYENSFIFKNFSFVFANTFNSFFIIAFLSSLFPSTPICHKDSSGIPDCFVTLELQVRTIFIVMFIKNIPELVVPLLKTFLKKLGRKGDKIPVNHPFIEIDSVIDNEYTMEPYVTNLEIDGTVADYMELIVQFGFLNMFSIAFPFAYPMAFANNILEILVDKTKLLHMTRRPIPNNAPNIGTWFVILDFISFISIFVNAGLICFTIEIIDGNQKYIFFSIMVICFLSLKYFVRVIVPDVSEKTLTLQKRHGAVEEKVVKGFKRRSQGIIKNEKVSMVIDGVSAANEEIMHKVTTRHTMQLELERELSTSKKKGKKSGDEDSSIKGSPPKMKYK